ncbi:MAG: hypothetical protein J6S67_12340 [Methanobrevibacter sp.]|nr:hypothetical protein [Methanobrevibacter sp.]
MGALIAGVVIAAVAGTAAIIGAAQNDETARRNAAQDESYIEDMYEINKEKADEEYAAAKEQAERNAEEAERQADLLDESLTVAEGGLANDFNAAIDDLYLSQQADTYSWNAAAMQSGSNEGAAYSQLASSGVRAGSSLSDAIEMEAAVNENQLQFAQDSKRQSDTNNLNSVLNNLAQNRFSIQQQRISADYARNDANYLRNSYLEGGHNYNLYQNQLKQLETTTDYNATKAKYEYEQHSGWNAFWNGVVAFGTGSAKGFQTGYNTYSNISGGLKA